MFFVHGYILTGFYLESFFSAVVLSTFPLHPTIGSWIVFVTSNILQCCDVFIGYMQAWQSLCCVGVVAFEFHQRWDYMCLTDIQGGFL